MRPLLRASEADFQALIMELAATLGWLCHHDRPSLNRSGRWSTAIDGDPGFPDLVLAKPGRPVHLWEVKTERGRLRPNQQAWLYALTGDRWLPTETGITFPTGRGFSVGVVRPSFWDSIREELS